VTGNDSAAMNRAYLMIFIIASSTKFDG